MFPIFVFFIIPFALAIQINEPVNGWTYYSSIVKLNLTYNSNPDSCWYSINNQENITFPCQEIYNIEIPYNNGSVNLTVYEQNITTTLSDSVLFYINNEFSFAKGIIVVGIIFFLFLLAISFWYVGLSLADVHTPIKLFLVLLGYFCISILLHVSIIFVQEYIHSEVIYTFFSSLSFVYSYILYVIIAYFLLNYIISIFKWVYKK